MGSFLGCKSYPGVGDGGLGVLLQRRVKKSGLWEKEISSLVY